MCKGPEVPRTDMVPRSAYSKLSTPEQACRAVLPLAPACVSSVIAPTFPSLSHASGPHRSCFCSLNVPSWFLPLGLCVSPSLCLEHLSLSSFLTHQSLTQRHLPEEAFLGHLIGSLQYSAISTPVCFCLAN